MATIKIAGYYNGDTNRQVVLVGEYPEGTMWSVPAEEDHYVLQLKGQDIAYRVCWPDQWQRGYEQKLIDGEFKDQLISYCDACWVLYKDNLAHTISANTTKRKTNININYFALAGRMEQCETILANNQSLQKLKDEQLAAEDAAKLEEQKLDELRQIREAEKVVADFGAIDGDMLITLADKYEINIPLRTRGWIKNKLNLISSDSLSFTKSNKQSRASDKPFEIYFKVRTAIRAIK